MTTNDQIKELTVAKAELHTAITADTERLETLRDRHAAALVDLRMGSKTAAKRVAAVALEIAEAERHLSSLQSEARSLEGRMAQVEADTHIAAITDAQARVKDIAAESDELAASFANTMRQAYELANRIHALTDENQKLRTTLRGDYPADDAPVVRQPGRLLNVGCLERVDASVSAFLKGNVSKRPVTLPTLKQGAQDMASGERFTITRDMLTKVSA